VDILSEIDVAYMYVACVAFTVRRRRRPFVRLRHRMIDVNVGRRVVFTCEADGVPLPVVFWTKDRAPLQNSSHVLLQTKR